MTTTTPSPGRDGGGAARGFTLVEMLIGSSLAAFILTAVMTTFLFLGRSGANVQNYNDMEAQSRRALEQFAQDVRQASEITWTSSTDITLVVDSANIRWRHVSGDGTFRRTAAGTERTMISGITTFTFQPYSITGGSVSVADLAAAGRQTKQLQISLEAQRTNRTVARATNLVLSARYILRNKRVTT
jgi:prepilin-type N-terminal cleavage/methylation domain-containing protein